VAFGEKYRGCEQSEEAMAAACGDDFTAVVTECGELWAFGKSGPQLGIGKKGHQPVPIRVGGREEFDGAAVVMVDAGKSHTAAVSANGTLWTWGDGENGKLGHGDEEPQQRPTMLLKEFFGGTPAVMVACGDDHTLVTTASGGVYSCGCGNSGKLGHGDDGDRQILTNVQAECFGGDKIVYVAAGPDHSAAVGAEGKVYTWGDGNSGRLGHNNEEDKYIPTEVVDTALSKVKVVMVSVGFAHTVAVSEGGTLYVWGAGMFGLLGLGDEDDRMVPTKVANFGRSPVLMVACGDVYTLAVTKDGGMYSCGQGQSCALGHNNENDKWFFTRIKAQYFDKKKIVSAATGFSESNKTSHSLAVTEDGVLYSFGGGQGLGLGDPHKVHRPPQVRMSMGGRRRVRDPNGVRRLIPTRIAPQRMLGARVGRCHSLPPLHVLAFAMGTTHARLGSAAQTETPVGVEKKSQRNQDKEPADAVTTSDDSIGCAYATMSDDLLKQVVAACGSWPEGRAGKLEGVVRLMGGGMMKT